MQRVLQAALFGCALALAGAGSASALTAPPPPVASVGSEFLPVAEGCGWGRWRGPWGGCRDTPYYGRLPDGGWAGGPPAAPPGDMGRWGSHWGCPPGWWHGPWGHCRHTPYHGPLPGGGWK